MSKLPAGRVPPLSQVAIPADFKETISLAARLDARGEKAGRKGQDGLALDLHLAALRLRSLAGLAFRVASDPDARVVH